ncbi:hypothetical protein H1235_08745 [Pseudoxanthomonas sp. NC8]|nr:hypothetical protein H1235_08745 [Pseudoxanthomonas sp. NC8]
MDRTRNRGGAGDPPCRLSAGNPTRHHLCESLFTRIVHLSRGEPKSDAIEAGVPAIFIDDSFRERQEVHARHGIPVLDPDAAEQLLDARA